VPNHTKAPSFDLLRREAEQARYQQFTYFADVVNSPSELENLVPFSQFASDLANNMLAQFSYIVPNIQDDAHNGTLNQADSWLKTNIAPLITNSTFQQDGLLVITFDESFDYSARTASWMRLLAYLSARFFALIFLQVRRSNRRQCSPSWLRVSPLKRYSRKLEEPVRLLC
jgi:Phosphoesterase family